MLFLIILRYLPDQCVRIRLLLGPVSYTHLDVYKRQDLIPAMWLRPSEAMTNLPFIGKLNTVFVVAVGLGMLIILMCMVLNIVNSLRSHDTEKVYLSLIHI